MVAGTNVQKYIAEFIGTYLLVFTVGCNVLSSPEQTATNWAATSIACVLMVSIYAMGNVSGANFNPAVSFALGLAGKMPFIEVIIYSIVHIVAGILAGLSFRTSLGGHGQKPFLLGPATGFSWYHVMIVEILYTCMLCFVVLNVATARKNVNNEFYGLAIGFVIIAGGTAVGGISGGVFNPAVAFGIEIPSGHFGWSYWYTLYQLAGAALAACLFRIVRPDDHGDVSEPEHFQYNLGTMLVSEFIGTFYLCLTVGFCVLGKSPATPWAAAASLTCMIYSLGNVSGAHFNPSVSLALVLRGEGVFPAACAAPYIIVQVISSLFAAFLCKMTHHNATYGFGPGPKATFGWAPIAAAEIMFTFVLCFVVLCVCTQAEPLKEFYGLAIGSCVTVGGFAVGAVSGGALNPALALGATLAHMSHGAPLINGLAFVALECLGAAFAVLAFKATHSPKDKAAM
jgi:aquaporin Z